MDKEFSFKEYQAETGATNQAPPKHNLIYLTLGLSEAGEVQGKVKKWIRGDYNYEILREKVADELGDLLWYVSELANHLDLNLGFIAQANLAKLADRHTRGVIQGDGDDR